MAYSEKELGALAKQGKEHCKGVCETMRRRLADPRFEQKKDKYKEQIAQLEKLIDAL